MQRLGAVLRPIGMPKTPADLMYGTLDVLVLKSLSWKPLHGYAISSWLQHRSGGTLQIDDAALYKALHRLEAQGAVGSEWGISDNNRRAKYYHLAPPGRRRLREDRQAWQAYVLAVGRILRAESA
jgi:PadR family transcriptional regulator PadR